MSEPLPPPYTPGNQYPQIAEQPPQFTIDDQDFPAPPSSSVVVTTTATTAASPAGVAPPATIMTTTASSGVPALAKEQQIVMEGIQTLIPAWQNRINTAVGKPIPINIDFNTLLAPCASSKTRLAAVKALLKPTSTVPNVGNPCVLEALTKSIEKMCTDPEVRLIVATSITEIVFLYIPSGTSPIKHLELQRPGPLVYRGCFEKGAAAGAYPRPELKHFFEMAFQAEERSLMNSFEHQTLPEAMNALSTMVGGKQIPIECDIRSIVGGEEKSKRLSLARLLVRQTGAAKTVSAIKDSTSEFAVKTIGAFEKTLTGKDTPKTYQKEGGKKNSPNVIVPLLAAISKAIGFDRPQHQPLFSYSISKIRIVKVPGPAEKKKMVLYDATGVTTLPASAFHGTQLPPNCVLEYQGAFDAGEKGCISASHIQDFLEAYFRFEERSNVTKVLTAVIPKQQQELFTAIQKNIPIEILWNTVLPPTLTDRPAVARLLASSNCIPKLVKGIVTAIIVDKSQATLEALQKKLLKIVIQCDLSGEGRAKSSLALHDGQILVYTVNLKEGPSKLLIAEAVKSQIWQLFGLSVSESGLQSGMRTMSEEFGKMGSSLAHSFKKFF